MKIILFRFEKEKINFLECDINAGNLVVGDRGNVSLESVENRGEKYNKVLDELLRIQTKYSAGLFVYQSPQKYMGKLRDEEGFANSAILHLFCHKNNMRLLELTPKIVREKLSVSNEEFKSLLEQEGDTIRKSYSVAKSDKIFDGLVFLSLLKNII
ncbi:MAG: hypothetical protein PHX21_06330 [bacterium]|nr:hypothetical protein [bacterium]